MQGNRGKSGQKKKNTGVSMYQNQLKKARRQGNHIVQSTSAN
jgi:hypothetical protein